MERNIFIYWTGKENNLISILRNLIYLHSTNGKGYKVHFITHENMYEYIKNIPDYFMKLCPAHQADFVRVNVVCDYGGIWLDSDTLVLDTLDTLFDIVEKKNGFFIKENKGLVPLLNSLSHKGLLLFISLIFISMHDPRKKLPT
jgi:mannosyltransferase OCH1-like enzyme